MSTKLQIQVDPTRANAMAFVTRTVQDITTPMTIVKHGLYLTAEQIQTLSQLPSMTTWDSHEPPIPIELIDPDFPIQPGFGFEASFFRSENKPLYILKIRLINSKDKAVAHAMNNVVNNDFETVLRVFTELLLTGWRMSDRNQVNRLLQRNEQHIEKLGNPHWLTAFVALALAAVTPPEGGIITGVEEETKPVVIDEPNNPSSE